MGNNKKERKRQWQEKNGILGELNLNVTEIFLLEEIMRKMSFDNYRALIGLSFFPGILGYNYISSTKEMVDALELKFQRLARHIRTQERIRLDLQVAESKGKEPSSCC